MKWFNPCFMGTYAKMKEPEMPFLRPNRKNVARATFKKRSKIRNL
jgi:hypothetical protein